MKLISIVFILTCSQLWGQNAISNYKKVLAKEVFHKDSISLNDSCSIIKISFETQLKSKIAFSGRITPTYITNSEDPSLEKI